MTTSTDLEHLDPDAGTLEVLPPRQTPSLAAQDMLMAHANMMETAYQLAFKMVKTTMVPKRFFQKAEDATAAILYGSELGLNPIQSLQRVIPIHGMPSIEARTMVALLKSRGYKVKTLAQSDTSVTVWGRDLDGEEYESTWTIERAIQAQYVPQPSSEDSLKRPTMDTDWVTVTKQWGNDKPKTSVLGNMKYITDPQAMLKAKAQSELCREMAPDVLLGISYTSEELESEYFDSRQVSSERGVPAAGAPVTVDEILGAPAEAPAPAPKKRPAKKKAEPVQEPVDAEVVADDAPTEVATGNQPYVDAAESAREKFAEPEPAEASESGSKPEPSQVDEPSTEAAPEDEVRKQSIRKLFVWLGKADVTEREDRLVIYRKALQRPEISSTNDLSNEDLEYVITGLEAHDKKGDLVVWAEAVLIAAVEAETAAAQQQPTTTTEGK